MEKYLCFKNAMDGRSIPYSPAASIQSSSIVKPHVNLEKQSVEVPDSNGARQSTLVPPGATSRFLYDDTKTLLQLMDRGMKASDNGPCIGWRDGTSEYRWLKYSEVIQRSKNFGAGLVNIGMTPGQTTHIGIYSKNCIEWILTEHACYHHSVVNVPLYDTLGPDAFVFIMNQVEMSIVVCDNETKVRNILGRREDIPTLKAIIVIKSINNQLKQTAFEKGVNLQCFEDIEHLGKTLPVKTMPSKPSDLATICYTSGTTGSPKGVMLTHEAFIINISGVALQLGDHGITNTDVCLSYLPLAHIADRILQAMMYMQGARIGFFSGDISLLFGDIKMLKPTIATFVPRIFNRLYDKVQSKVSGSKLKQFLMHVAIAKKKAELENFIVRNNSKWDVVFKSLREELGGRFRILFTGSAPLADHVLTFFRCALGCLILEAYGQTETASACTLTVPGDYVTGHVGPPVPCCHIKLVDVPEKQYFVANGQGEVCVKGPNMCKGYYKNPEKTSETIDAEGWVHTADIGEWLPNGTLKIIDRKCNIFKMAQGEYIQPEKIQNVYLDSKYVMQVFVYADRLWSFLVAIVVPDEDVVRAFYKAKGISGSWQEICKDEALKNFILDDIRAVGSKAGLNSLEQVKAIHICPEPFTLENNLLTPTMKLKREQLFKHFKTELYAMHAKIAKPI